MEWNLTMPPNSKEISTNETFPRIYGLNVLQDNIIWIWIEGKNAVVVDPAISEPVQVWLKARGLNLCGVLQTHHHIDHIGGTKELLELWPKAEVIASKSDQKRIPFQTISVEDGNILQIFNQNVHVLEVPGHTMTHLAYYCLNSQSGKCEPILFCGDTLFGGGCGRLFEGTPTDMFHSLEKINNLPKETKIYCAHEYTKENLIWANSIEPNNLNIKDRLNEVKQLRQKGLSTLPTSIEIERKTNLFLKASTPRELGKLRSNKDNWRNL